MFLPQNAYTEKKQTASIHIKLRYGMPILYFRHIYTPETVQDFNLIYILSHFFYYLSWDTKLGDLGKMLPE